MALSGCKGQASESKAQEKCATLH